MRHRSDGLRKRCGCPRRQWSKCLHPWHIGFAYNGKEHRWSLHKVASKPAGYWMSKEGTLTDTAAPSPDARLTFGDVVERYVERHVRVPTRRRAAQ